MTKVVIKQDSFLNNFAKEVHFQVDNQLLKVDSSLKQKLSDPKDFCFQRYECTYV